MITQTELKEKLKYCPITGIFEWIGKNKGKKVGSFNGQYLRVSLNKKEYLLHRLAWLYVYGDFPKNQIDHINGLKQDNRISNLRDVLPRQNSQNLNIHREGKLVGCYYKNGKWHAQIRVEKERYFIGIFNSQQEASEAYFNALNNLDAFLKLKPKKPIKNVYYNKRDEVYIARVYVNKFCNYLGSFKSEIEALSVVKTFKAGRTC